MSKSKPAKKSEDSKLVFGGFEVVDKDGNVIGNDPARYPELMELIAEVVATIQTGKVHRVVKRESND